MRLLYVSPHFPYHRHGFELDELRLLAKRVRRLDVLSLRTPTKADWEWLSNSGWDEDFDISWPSKIWSAWSPRGHSVLRRWTRPAVGALKRDPRAYKLFAGIVLGLGTARWAERLGASWIHADFTSLPGTVADTLSVATGLPYSLMAHAFDVFSTIPAGDATRYALAEKSRRADLLFAENSAAEHAFRQANAEHGVDKPIYRKKNAIHVHEFNSGTTWSLRGRVGAFGALIEKKGLDTVIDAVSNLRNRGHDITLELFGDGPLRDELEAHARAQRCPVTFHGRYHRQQLPGFLDSLDVVLMGSRVDASGDSDGTPTVIMEAFAHGRPVVGTTVGALPDLVRPNVNGFLVPPDDPVAMSAAVEQLLVSEDLRRDLGLGGRRVVEEEFSVETEVAGFLDQVTASLAERS